jgi:hypothetical protein
VDFTIIAPPLPSVRTMRDPVGGSGLGSSDTIPVGSTNRYGFEFAYS